MLSLQSFLREGRGVGLCWAQLKPKGPEGRGSRDQDRKSKMRIGRPAGASKELIRSLSRDVKCDFGVREATM